MFDVPLNFGCNVFGDREMKDRLSPEAYTALHTAIDNQQHIELSVANQVATVMKDWAVEKGCTHFCHWFQPMTGVTAEKHDSFIHPVESERVIMDFSGKELVKGEPDASSFPHGGIRATFEARGYTAWDATEHAFIKDRTLYIPTAFFSYGGDALDKKTPLLRSMQLLEKQTRRIMSLFGKTPKTVTTTVGAEQEYFLIAKELYDRRLDLQMTGRTLFGARAPKGQEMEDHYFGSINPDVLAFMAELDEELWKLGVLAKTEHNEAAPSQHELAPIYNSCNTACDHNQLTMELMKRIAVKHGFACLLHEKPFEGINGSGKHNNWAISADGANIFDSGDTPRDNLQFLLFLTAVLKAVDEHQDLIRIGVASASNDHRLGAAEAPPAIVSIYLGDELQEVLTGIVEDKLVGKRKKSYLDVGTAIIPNLRKDTTDRNRTSPIAFTGNKFEVRMVGASASIADINIMLNTIVAAALDKFADELSRAKDFDREVSLLIRREIIAHNRIVFNGNNYSEEWKQEARRRGLLELPTTVDAVPYLIRPENIALFEKYGILSAKELNARYEILLESYSKIINIEALTMLEMVTREVLPASFAYVKDLTTCVLNLKSLDKDSGVKCFAEESILREVSQLNSIIYSNVKTLEMAEIDAKSCTDKLSLAQHYQRNVLKIMQGIRMYVDKLEAFLGKRYWSLPTYSDLLF